jgi:hypothetical protein
MKQIIILVRRFNFNKPLEVVAMVVAGLVVRTERVVAVNTRINYPMQNSEQNG